MKGQSVLFMIIILDVAAFLVIGLGTFGQHGGTPAPAPSCAADWFDANYTSRYPNNISYSGTGVTQFPYVLNGSTGFWFEGVNQLVWSNGTANSLEYLYFNTTNYTEAVNGGRIATEAEFGSSLGNNTPTAVWNSSFKAVWHMSNPRDSTNNSKTFTVLSGTLVPGKIGNGYNDMTGNKTSDADFNGTASGGFTIEGWVNLSTTGWQTMVSKAIGSADADAQFLLQYYNAVTFCAGQSPGFSFVLRSNLGWNCANYATNPTATVGKWYYVAGTFDGTNLRIYVDGVLRNTTAIVGTYQTTTTNLFFGKRGIGDAPLDGILDEVRYSNTVMPASYFLAVNQSMTPTGNFSVFGTPTTCP